MNPNGVPDLLTLTKSSLVDKALFDLEVLTDSYDEDIARNNKLLKDTIALRQEFLDLDNQEQVNEITELIDDIRRQIEHCKVMQRDNQLFIADARVQMSKA